MADFVDAFAAKLALPKFAVAGNSMGGGVAWQLAVRHDNRSLIAAGLQTDVYDKSLITQAVIDRWAEFQRAPGHRAILMDVNFGAHSAASPEVLGSIKVPTLVLRGESDVLIEPASARKFAAAIAGAKPIVYKQVGHLPQIEIPQRSAADAAAFLNVAPSHP